MFEGDHRSDRDSERDDYGRGDAGFGEAGYRDERYYAEGGYARTGSHRAPEPTSDAGVIGGEPAAMPRYSETDFPSGRMQAYRDQGAPGRHGRTEPPHSGPRGQHLETGAPARVPARPAAPPRGDAAGGPPRRAPRGPRPAMPGPVDNDDTGPIPRIPPGPPPGRPLPGGSGALPRVPAGPGTGGIPRLPSGLGAGAVPRIPPGQGPSGHPTGPVPRLPGGPGHRPPPGGTGALPRTPGGPVRPNPAGPRPVPPMPPRRAPEGPGPGALSTGQHPVAPGRPQHPAGEPGGRPRPADPFPTGRHHRVAPGPVEPFARPGHDSANRRDGAPVRPAGPGRADRPRNGYGSTGPATGGFAVADGLRGPGSAQGRDAYQHVEAYREDRAEIPGNPASTGHEDATPRDEVYRDYGADPDAGGYEAGYSADDYDGEEEFAADDYDEDYDADDYAEEYEAEEYDTDDEESEPRTGPFDYDEVADILEEISAQRLDLGSILLPVPDGGQLQVEMTPDGTPQAVHLATPHGRLTVAAYAAPKSPGQWRTVAADLAESLRADGAQVSVQTGPWGRELHAVTEGADLRFIGIDGYRWMVRLVAAGPSGAADDDTPLVEAARRLLADTVVRRGEEPMPVREPLPVVLPQELADQLMAAHQQQVDAQEQAAAAQAAAAEVAATGTFPVVTPEQQGPRRSTGGSAMQQLGRN